LNTFGIKLARGGDLEDFQLSPQRYTPARYKVEGDWSSASYLLALGAVAGDIQVSNLQSESLQGDKALVEFLREMGARVEVKSDSVSVNKQDLKAIEADLNNCIDLLPTMAVLAALAEGTSQFRGIKRARLKESNRIGALRSGLERLSIEVGEEEDRLTIRGGKPREGVVEAGNDHRIAMAFSLLGAAAGPVTIRGAECVSKTFPDYWMTLAELGVRTDEQ
jgi:3-phosphoshikimate 1-carboxyvinyltransferase